ncbi:MAG: hypothetical protein WCL04_06025 [Verrucomicrobiota bacterium]
MSRPASLDGRQWRQVALLTLGALALYLTLRALPTGTNLHQLDFTVTGTGALELCDPANPQFVPVVAARSPVTLTVTPQPGDDYRFLLHLATSSGKPIGPAELLEVHTRKLHLLIVDPKLGDYQHVHPEPTANIGEWSFTFAPAFTTTYRVFADFTPIATGRSLYASADIGGTGPADSTGGPAARDTPPAWPAETWRAERDGFVFQLKPSVQPIRAGQPVDLNFILARTDGGPVIMEPVMGAFAHLVTFDAARSGFAHLHPDPANAANLSVTSAPSAASGTTAVTNPHLAFKLTIPSPGPYVIWAQVKLDGHERFVPFWFEVAP